jgi:TM2 domain-containing membrane protein YozV
MDGVVLGVDTPNGRGAIRVSTGDRFYFALSEWRGGVMPVAGMRVDFERAPDGSASNVFPLSKATVATAHGKPERSRVVAAVLAILLGEFGAHKFYAGSWGLGLLYILFSWTTLPFLISIVEGIAYLAMSDDDFQDKYSRINGPFGFLW